MSDSSSSLSSALSDIDEPAPPPPKKQKILTLNRGKLSFAAVQNGSRQSSPEASPPRELSPPHEYILEDNPDIAFLTMFRHRFADAFPRHAPNLGPQDIESGIGEGSLSEPVESFLCALLGLVLNRKRDVERGHWSRALEDAISSQKHQWPPSWNGANPLPGQRTFADLGPNEKALAWWALNTSDVIRDIIATAYKQSRSNDDLNQPLSVQPWGTDGPKKKYWLIEGRNDTSFRIYKQSSSKAKKETWWSVAGSIDELKSTAEKLRTSDGSQAARRLADRMELAIPRFEASEEKRKRKEYRQARKAAFTRPEPGFSLYEGRTRGRRMKYTFSDDEDDSESASIRRSNRHSDQSATTELPSTTVTLSGRQVRSRYGRSYGDAMQQDHRYSGQHDNLDLSDNLDGDVSSNRQSRARGNGNLQRSRMQNVVDGYSDEDEDEDSNASGDQWQGNDEDFEGKLDVDDDDDEMSDDESDDLLSDAPQKSLIVTLRYRKRYASENSDGMTISEQRQDSHDSSSIVNIPPISAQPAEKGQPSNLDFQDPSSKLSTMSLDGRIANGTLTGSAAQSQHSGGSDLSKDSVMDAQSRTSLPIPKLQPQVHMNHSEGKGSVENYDSQALNHRPPQPFAGGTTQSNNIPETNRVRPVQ